jgi:hypothetical protein
MSGHREKFTNIVLNELKYYVYIYSNPVTNEIFYVGKGKGNRVFSHLKDEGESQKVEYIRTLKEQNLKPNIEILIHGIEDEETALRVEASIIDILGLLNLSNKKKGWKSATYGRMTIEQIISAYDKQKVDIDEKAMLIRISQAFRYSMTDTELYDYTRGQWKLNVERARKAKYALAIYGGIVQEVYEILDWYEAGKTYSVRLDNKNINRRKGENLKGRYEFIGNFAPQGIRKKYKFKSVEHYFIKGNKNPIMYLNC